MNQKTFNFIFGAYWGISSTMLFLSLMFLHENLVIAMVLMVPFSINCGLLYMASKAVEQKKSQ